MEIKGELKYWEYFYSETTFENLILKKMKTFLSIVIIFIASPNAYSQDGSTFIFDPENDVYANNYLNGPAAGRGNTGVSSCAEGISGIFLNPASFNVNKKFDFSFQYNYKTNSSYVYNQYKDPIDTYKQKFPSISAAAGCKVNKYLEFGLFYNNPTAMYDDFGADYKLTYTIQTIGIPMRFSYKGFHFGLSLEYSYYYSVAKGTYYYNYLNTFHANAEDFNVRLGMAYETPDKVFSAGASIIPGTTLKPHSDIPGPVGDEYYGWPAYPFQIIVGFAIQLPKFPLKLLFEYKEAERTYVFFRSVDDLKIGAEYRISKKIIVRSGAFTNQNTGKFNGQIYLTAGCGVNISNLNIDAAIMDSHISNGPTNTIFQTSIAYGF